MAARTLLLKLEQRGLVQLPARRQVPINRMRAKQITAPFQIEPSQPIARSLSDLLPLTLCEVSIQKQPGQRALFDALLHHYHYLSHRLRQLMEFWPILRKRR